MRTRGGAYGFAVEECQTCSRALSSLQYQAKKPWSGILSRADSRAGAERAKHAFVHIHLCKDALACTVYLPDGRKHVHVLLQNLEQAQARSRKRPHRPGSQRCELCTLFCICRDSGQTPPISSSSCCPMSTISGGLLLSGPRFVVLIRGFSLDAPPQTLRLTKRSQLGSISQFDERGSLDARV